jgi:hypothetical protein
MAGTAAPSYVQHKSLVERCVDWSNRLGTTWTAVAVMFALHSVYTLTVSITDVYTKRSESAQQLEHCLEGSVPLTRAFTTVCQDSKNYLGQLAVIQIVNAFCQEHLDHFSIITEIFGFCYNHPLWAAMIGSAFTGSSAFAWLFYRSFIAKTGSVAPIINFFSGKPAATPPPQQFSPREGETNSGTATEAVSGGTTVEMADTSASGISGTGSNWSFTPPNQASQYVYTI